MKIGRSISTAIAAHTVLKTGVHGVATAYLSKTSQSDQSLSDTEMPAAIARDTEVTAAVAAEATARGNADTALSGEIDTDVAAEATARDLAIAAAAKSIASGTYTGNDADNRQITTGFKCSKVIVIMYTAGPRRWVAIPNNTIGDDNGSYISIKTDVTLHATDGFEVDATDANTSGQSYYYWAISE